MHGEKSTFDGNCGVMAYNRTDQEKGRATVYRPVEKWIVAAGKHPGIIPSGQWIRTQTSLERNKSKSYRKPRSNEALLTGLLFCACGGRMYPKQSKRQISDASFSYVCKMKERSKKERCDYKNADGNTLDAAVMGQIKGLVACKRTFITLLKKNRQRFENSEAISAQEDLRGMLTQNEKKIGSLIDSMSLLENREAKLQIAGRIEELQEKGNRIRQRLQEREPTEQTHNLTDAAFDRLRESLSDYATGTGEMTLEEKREAIRCVIYKVI